MAQDKSIDLIGASSEGDVNVMDTLLEMGVDIETKDKKVSSWICIPISTVNVQEYWR